jgi:hypothetical protein
MNNKVPKEASKLAGRDYDVSDYQKEDQLASGLAKTHEQVSDTYMVGECQPNVDKENSK